MRQSDTPPSPMRQGLLMAGAQVGANDDISQQQEEKRQWHTRLNHDAGRSSHTTREAVEGMIIVESEWQGASDRGPCAAAETQDDATNLPPHSVTHRSAAHAPCWKVLRRRRRRSGGGAHLGRSREQGLVTLAGLIRRLPKSSTPSWARSSAQGDELLGLVSICGRTGGVKKTGHKPPTPHTDMVIGDSTDHCILQDLCAELGVSLTFNSPGCIRQNALAENGHPYGSGGGGHQ